ncbi:hypothetical protein [Pseudogemmobacter sonorensis]|uniref:hypothetical protein n=1 Tax=Pseudogemmobacter sonorensis TaxID=2989681 RepID=UPI00368DF4AD
MEFGDEILFAEMLDRHPDVEKIIVGNSPGGNLHAGIEIARLIFDRDLSVQINGPAASAATVIALAARQKLEYLPDSYVPDVGTELLFHCAYMAGNSYCDEFATRRSARVLGEITGKPEQEWFDLMMATTPDTVVRVGLEEILQYDDWYCDYAGFGRGIFCERIILAGMEPQEKTAGSPFAAPAGQCWLELRRSASADEAFNDITGIGMLMPVDVENNVFITYDDHVAITFGLVDASGFDRILSELGEKYSVGDLSGVCADGQDYAGRYKM